MPKPWGKEEERGQANASSMEVEEGGTKIDPTSTTSSDEPAATKDKENVEKKRKELDERARQYAKQGQEDATRKRAQKRAAGKSKA